MTATRSPYAAPDLRRAALAAMRATNAELAAENEALRAEVERLKRLLGDDVRRKAGIVRDPRRPLWTWDRA